MGVELENIVLWKCKQGKSVYIVIKMSIYVVQERLGLSCHPKTTLIYNSLAGGNQAQMYLQSKLITFQQILFIEFSSDCSTALTNQPTI